MRLLLPQFQSIWAPTNVLRYHRHNTDLFTVILQFLPTLICIFLLTHALLLSLTHFHSYSSHSPLFVLTHFHLSYFFSLTFICHIFSHSLSFVRFLLTHSHSYIFYSLTLIRTLVTHFHLSCFAPFFSLTLICTLHYQGDARALSTVTAVIDGTGSFGAAFGPLLVGMISSHGTGMAPWDHVFIMLCCSSLIAALLLTRLVVREVRQMAHERRKKRSRQLTATA